MTRREFSALAASSMTAAQPPRAGRPNIIFILADDLGYGDLGCYGQERIRTPNIDRIAAEGAKFTSAYSGATVCAPSRCCLMTGKHGGHATVRGNLRPELGLMPGEPTIASVLKGAGYDTAIFGKWGLGGPGTGTVPTRAGFGEFYGYLDQLHAHNSFPEHLWHNQDEVFLTENWFDGRKTFAPDLFTRRALDFVSKKRANPFFLYLTYTVPHADNERTKFDGIEMDVPSTEPYSNESWPEVEKRFAAVITRMDADIGRLLDALKESGRDGDTLLVFSSDNGPHKEGGHDPDFFRSRGPLRGTKRDLYEGGIRVPFLARWPGKIRGGRVSDQPFAFWDMLPTFSEAAGVKPPAGIDGVTVMKALTGEQPLDHPPLYWEFHENRFAQAVRFAQWKAVRTDLGRPVELYDLSQDPGEVKDVATAQPAMVAKAEEMFRSLRVDSKHFPIRAGRPAAKKK